MKCIAEQEMLRCVLIPMLRCTSQWLAACASVGGVACKRTVHRPPRCSISSSMSPHSESSRACGWQHVARSSCPMPKCAKFVRLGACLQLTLFSTYGENEMHDLLAMFLAAVDLLLPEAPMSACVRLFSMFLSLAHWAGAWPLLYLRAKATIPSCSISESIPLLYPGAPTWSGTCSRCTCARSLRCTGVPKR